MSALGESRSIDPVTRLVRTTPSSRPHAIGRFDHAHRSFAAGLGYVAGILLLTAVLFALITFIYQSLAASLY